MRNLSRFGLALAVTALLPVSGAAASQISGGSTVTYTATPGETNHVLVSLVRYDTSCAPLAAPCLSVWDSGARIGSATGGCVVASSDPIAGDTATCPVPAAVAVSLGDHDDSYWGWDGPDTVDAGSGNDNPVFGEGGDDVLRGGVGADVLIGQYGDDTLDGGPGDDNLEGVPGGHEDETATAGSDTYIGGGGGDSVTYEERSENLSLSPDGVADDGAAGEHDNIGADISLIMAGHGSDRLTGNAGRNLFSGGAGDDVLTGGGGDDQLNGGYGNDRLIGGDGQDVLGGDDGDDLLDGGAGVDRYYGDDVTRAWRTPARAGRT
jgi:Ca2+-binding RTX toxin-like protein